MERAANRVVGAQQVAGVEPLLGMLHEHVHRAPVPMPLLRVQPIFERRRAVEAEAVGELAAHQRRRRCPVAPCDQAIQLVGIQFDRAGRQLELIRLGVHSFFTDVAPQHAHRLAQ